MRTCGGSWAQQAATQPHAGHLQPHERYLWQDPLPDPSLSGPDRLNHLDLLALDFHRLLPRSQRRWWLQSCPGKVPAESGRSGRFCPRWSPDHDDFEDAESARTGPATNSSSRGGQASGRRGYGIPWPRMGSPSPGLGEAQPPRGLTSSPLSALRRQALCVCMCVRTCLSVYPRVYACAPANVCARARSVKGASHPSPPQRTLLAAQRQRHKSQGGEERDGSRQAFSLGLCPRAWDPRRSPRPLCRHRAFALNPPLPGPQGHTGGKKPKEDRVGGEIRTSSSGWSSFPLHPFIL